MDFARRNRYLKKYDKENGDTDKIVLNFDISSLNIMCSYVLSENKNIKRNQLVNMKNLFEIIDDKSFINDNEKYKRFKFIKLALKARLEKEIKNRDILIKVINGGITEEDLLDVDTFPELGNGEVDWVDQTISTTLKWSFAYVYSDKLLDITTRFKASDYRNKEEIVKELEDTITDLKNEFRHAKVENFTDLMFTLEEDKLDQILKDTYERATNPTTFLKTGMQGFNMLLDGGFEKSRVYMIFGVTGVGKSLLLLNLAYQMKLCNANYELKDKTKKAPCIVYMTMENGVYETILRLFSIVNNTTGKMSEYSMEEVIRIIKDQGKLVMSDTNPINIVIKFVPDGSVDTNHLYTITEDLEDEGYEVIAFIQDHMKKIKSAKKISDLRQELGAIINEFKVFATFKDIPVISNSHINREGIKILEEAVKNGDLDASKRLGKSLIGDSSLILDNVDVAININTTYDSQHIKYMAFNRIKMRGNDSGRSFIYQPFKENNLALEIDYDLPVPLFKETLIEGSGFDDISNNKYDDRYVTNIRLAEENNSSYNMSVLDDDDNTFLGGVRYSN